MTTYICRYMHTVYTALTTRISNSVKVNEYMVEGNGIVVPARLSTTFLMHAQVFSSFRLASYCKFFAYTIICNTCKNIIVANLPCACEI